MLRILVIFIGLFTSSSVFRAECLPSGCQHNHYGKIEENIAIISAMLQQIQVSSNKSSQKLNLKISDLNSYLNELSMRISAIENTLSNHRNTKEKAQQDISLYSQAFSAIRAGNHEIAIKCLDDLINTQQESHLLMHAKYLLGKTHYKMNNFKKAAKHLNEVYIKNPNAYRGQKALYWLILSTIQTEKIQDPCSYIENVISNMENSIEKGIVKDINRIKEQQCIKK